MVGNTDHHKVPIMEGLVIVGDSVWSVTNHHKVQNIEGLVKVAMCNLFDVRGE